MKKLNLNFYFLLLLLFVLSLLKDLITPDYLNTPSVQFLNPINTDHTALETIFSHPIYWILSLAYSLQFILLPIMIAKALFPDQSLKWMAYILIGICAFEYMLVFSHQTSLMQHLLPKVNRYFHSPVLTLFFIATLTINHRRNGSD